MRKYFDADRLVSIAAIIVSVGSLFVIIYQTSLMRKQQKASVMPSLNIGYSIHSDDESVLESVILMNQGLGPAFIKRVEILEKDTVYQQDVYTYITSLEEYNPQETNYFNRIYEGRIISEEARLRIFEKRSDSASSVLLQELFAFPYQINKKEPSGRQAVIQITYENVYGDQWVIRSDRNTPEKR